MIVFVHGVPETDRIWAKVRRAIGRESVALSMPGFGCPRPDHFGATMDDYAGWLVGELDGIDGPIDLVGHDWGALLTYRVATAHGDRLHSWIADVGNVAHPDYEWHAFAKVWQTPTEGEAFVANESAMSIDDRSASLELMGVPHDDAAEMAAGSSATMGACILDLYRSALPNLHARWGPWSPTPAPGLVLHSSEDPFSDAALAAEVATALGARFETLEGAGHFWPYQAPEAAAAVLESFWSSLP
jgi:pimeloyl-ACP methyl ester carboxylesterase